jgi:AcrR family transcriptional regulator
MKIKYNQEVVGTEIKNSELVREKRLQIAKGASKLFIKKGFHQTTIREISKVTGITSGNIYNYITKKEDILYLVFEVFHTLWINRLEEERVFEIEDPVEQLEVALQKMFELVSSYREMVLLVYRESKLLPKKFLRILLEKEKGHIECFEKILDRGVEKGVFKTRDAFLLANIIVYLLSMEPLRGWNFGKKYKAGEVNEFTIKFIKSAIMK